MMAAIVAFASRKVINRSFSTIDRKHSLRIPVFDAQRIYLFLSMFRKHLSAVL